MPLLLVNVASSLIAMLEVLKIGQSKEIDVDRRNAARNAIQGVPRFLGPKWITVHALRIHSQMNDGTLPGPGTFKRTDRPSPSEIASVATSRCSSRFGPPYCAVAWYRHWRRAKWFGLPSHAGSTGSVKVMLNPSAALPAPTEFRRWRSHLVSAAASRDRVPFQLQLPLEPVPPAYKQPSGPREGGSHHTQPLGEPENSPLDFSLHLFKLHAADPAHGQFAQEELPGKRAIMNFQRRGRRI